MGHLKAAASALTQDVLCSTAILAGGAARPRAPPAQRLAVGSPVRGLRAPDTHGQPCAGWMRASVSSLDHDQALMPPWTQHQGLFAPLNHDPGEIALSPGPHRPKGVPSPWTPASPGGASPARIGCAPGISPLGPRLKAYAAPRSILT